MKTAGIISVGTEIMFGKIDDTNSTYLSRWLKDCGITVKFRVSAPDVIDEITSAIKYVKDADLIILTGGLGPTSDDITREALSKYLSKKLVFKEDEYQKILNFFSRLNRPAPISNRKQAELIDGAEFLTNKNGTAPGMFFMENDKIFVLLPGPPLENQPMIKNGLFPKLKENGFIQGNILSKVYRLYNVGESAAADLFASFDEDVELGYYFTSGGWCEIHLTKYVTGEAQSTGLVSASKKAEKILNDAGIFFTEDKDIAQLVLEKLEQKKMTLSFAESITGGNLSGEFVKTPGVSKVFIGAVISYSNEAKKDILGVRQDSLDKHGAVSEEVVKEMVLGLKKLTGSDIGVSISGVAGPDGGTKEKPVGLVYFGFLFGDELYVKKEIIPGHRTRVMTRAINMVFVEILKRLK
ncbi:MAG: CinA family nicotinamide mononucleotide deamidase-related protein [bacterium]